MNIMNKLTLRTLKENKRRTFITIIGVIISVAMITAVSTIAVSFMDTLQRQEIAHGGEWHVAYENVDKNQLEGILQDKNTKTSFITKDIGYAELAGSKNEYKPYLFLQEFNMAAFRYFPVNLVEGRLPLAPNEVIISEHIWDNGQVEIKLGDTLTLEVGERYYEDPDFLDVELDQDRSLIAIEGKNQETLVNTKTVELEIVGIMERPSWEPYSAPGYTIVSYLNESELQPGDTFDVYVLLKKINRSVFDDAEKLAEDLNIDNVKYNYSLLRLYGVTDDDSLNRFMYSIAAILMGIILVGSVSLIYNAFAISVSERARYLGMLSSIGATKKQKRNSVFFEGFVIGAISIPIGILAGVLGIGVTFIFINSFLESALGISEKLKVVVTPWSIFVAVGVSALTIFISAYIPARKASKISAIDAIRQTQDIKLTRKQVKTSKLIRNLFGFEAEIGLKNLKRNKRRYTATVFSLVISIVLFLSIAYFTNNLKRAYEMTQLDAKYDLYVSFPIDEEDTENREAADLIMKFDDVTEANLMLSNYVYTVVDEETLGEGFLEWLKEVEEYMAEPRNQYHVTLYGLSEESLKTYMEKAGIKADLSGNKPKAIVVNKNVYKDYETGQYVELEVFNGKVGDTLTLTTEQWDEEGSEKITLGDVEIAALTAELPLGISKENTPNTLNIIISEEDYLKMVSKGESDYSSYPYYNLYLNSKDPAKTEKEIEDLKLAEVYTFNYHQAIETDKQFAMMLSVFIYGFISLITAISVANIFNTISTSIALRKREFAMLKSVGMTPKSFNKMINFESVFYGMKALLYGLPISIGIMYLQYISFQESFVYSFQLPWTEIMIAVLSVFIIVGSAMLYSSAKIKKENIIEGLRQENL